MNTDNESQALTITEARGQLATRSHPMDTLALMSDSEFEQRLDSLKLAQRRMERVQRELMKENVDYGVIPGTGSKPTLLKPGAEKLAKFHHLVPTFDQQTILGDGVTSPNLRVLSVCSLHAETEDGPIVGQGLGAANSWEKKHRYRDAQRRCPMCQQATIFKSKQQDGGWFCWAKKGGCGATFRPGDRAIEEQLQGQAENPDPFDNENTLEKMSAKRAYVDATLRATATSGLFSQDLEDIDVGEGNGHRPAPAAKPAPAKPAPPKAAPAKAAQVDDAIPEFKHVGEFLTWGHKVTGLDKKNMLAELGVENELAIKDYAAAAGVLKRFAEESRKQQAPEATDADFTEQA